jgi:2-phosphosulfolactate phosphatase
MPRAFPEVKIVEGLEGAASARGHVVIIDVLRAFTTAAYAFAVGAETIELVATPEEALARPGWRMGEVGGKLIPGFDHNNSPSQLIRKRKLRQRIPRRVIMRTGSGTRCAVAAAPHAASLWLASLTVAAATAVALRYVDLITLVVSGAPDEGEEDRACAELLEALLTGKKPDWDKARRDVRGSRAAAKHSASDPDRPLEDIDVAVESDVFVYAMRARLEDGRLIARPVRPETGEKLEMDKMTWR